MQQFLLRRGPFAPFDIKLAQHQTRRTVFGVGPQGVLQFDNGGIDIVFGLELKRTLQVRVSGKLVRRRCIAPNDTQRDYGDNNQCY